MKKWIPLALLTLLGGCWFDNAPEIYQVTYTFTETGGRSVSSGAVICDYRGQTATRDCAFSVDIPNEHLKVESVNLYDSDVIEFISDPRFETSPRFGKHKQVTLNLDLSAHGRKEDRYTLAVSGLSPWDVGNNLTARTDAGTPVMIVSDSDLRAGVSLKMAPSPEAFLEHYKIAYSKELISILSCKGEGCGYIDTVRLEAVEPFKPASLSLIWTPIDEDQIPAAGSGQTS